MSTPMQSQQPIASTEDISTTMQRASTPLFIGADIVIQGTVIYNGKDPKAVLMLVGKIEGNIKTNGILQIVEGAVVQAESSIECSEIIVAGKIVGKGVIIKTQSLKLEATGDVEADLVCLPPGGLEQFRGGILNARLDMSPAHATAAHAPADLPVEKPSSATAEAIPAFLVAGATGKGDSRQGGHLHTFGANAPVKEAPSKSGQVIALGAEYSFGSSTSGAVAELPGDEESTHPASAMA